MHIRVEIESQDNSLIVIRSPDFRETKFVFGREESLSKESVDYFSELSEVELAT